MILLKAMMNELEEELEEVCVDSFVYKNLIRANFKLALENNSRESINKRIQTMTSTYKKYIEDGIIDKFKEENPQRHDDIQKLRIINNEYVEHFLNNQDEYRKEIYQEIDKDKEFFDDLSQFNNICLSIMHSFIDYMLKKYPNYYDSTDYNSNRHTKCLFIECNLSEVKNIIASLKLVYKTFPLSIDWKKKLNIPDMINDDLEAAYSLFFKLVAFLVYYNGHKSFKHIEKLLSDNKFINYNYDLDNPEHMKQIEQDMKLCVDGIKLKIETYSNTPDNQTLLKQRQEKYIHKYNKIVQNKPRANSKPDTNNALSIYLNTNIFYNVFREVKFNSSLQNSFDYGRNNSNNIRYNLLSNSEKNIFTDSRVLIYDNTIYYIKSNLYIYAYFFHNKNKNANKKLQLIFLQYKNKINTHRNHNILLLMREQYSIYGLYMIKRELFSIWKNILCPNFPELCKYILSICGDKLCINEDGNANINEDLIFKYVFQYEYHRYLFIPTQAEIKQELIKCNILKGSEEYKIIMKEYDKYLEYATNVLRKKI